MATEQDDDAATVKNAELRARIMGAIPKDGTRVNRKMVADTLGQPQLANNIGTTMTALAESGQLNMEKEGNQKWYWMGNGDAAPAQERAPRKARKAAKKPDGTREVEVAMDGVTVIFGRNPTSGRLRFEIIDSE